MNKADVVSITSRDQQIIFRGATAEHLQGIPAGYCIRTDPINAPGEHGLSKRSLKQPQIFKPAWPKRIRVVLHEPKRRRSGNNQGPLNKVSKNTNAGKIFAEHFGQPSSEDVEGTGGE